MSLTIEEMQLSPNAKRAAHLNTLVTQKGNG